MSRVSEASWGGECIQRKIPGGLRLQLDSTALLLSQRLHFSHFKSEEGRFIWVPGSPIPASLICLPPSKHFLPWWWKARTSPPGVPLKRPWLCLEWFSFLCNRCCLLYLISDSAQKSPQETDKVVMHVHVGEETGVQRGKHFFVCSCKSDPKRSCVSPEVARLSFKQLSTERREVS